MGVMCGTWGYVGFRVQGLGRIHSGRSNSLVYLELGCNPTYTWRNPHKAGGL